jgi:hypothetical protein
MVIHIHMECHIKFADALKKKRQRERKKEL